MSQQHINKNNNKHQRGGYIIFLAIAFISLLAIVGLVVDAAKLYRSKAELQTAVDAAAIAGGRLLVTTNLPFDKVKEFATQVFNENLRLAKVSEAQIVEINSGVNGQRFDLCFNDPDNPTTTCEATATERKAIQASAIVSHPTLILGAIPGFPQIKLSAAQSSALGLQLQILLVLDVSGSMKNCMTGNNTCAADDPNRKMNALKDAVKALVGMLLPFDKLGIVTFSASDPSADGTVTRPSNGEPANTVANWSTLLNNFDNDSRNNLVLTQTTAAGKITIEDEINLLDPNGSTNIGSGLRRARQIFDQSPLSASDKLRTLRLIVLATDGATNTGNPLTWFNVAHPTPTPSGTPTPGVDTDPYRPLNKPLYSPPRVCNSPFFLPTPTNQNFGGVTLPRLRFLDVVIESDHARDAGYLVWSIGIGSDDPDRKSPFQDFDNMQQMKQALLTRTANDQEQMPLPAPNYTTNWTFVGTPIAIATPTPVPNYPWDFPCVPGGQVLRSSGKKIGRYTLATDRPALIEAFENIATVRLKVTQ